MFKFKDLALTSLFQDDLVILLIQKSLLKYKR